jgi:hypothetical protein
MIEGYHDGDAISMNDGVPSNFKTMATRYHRVHMTTAELIALYPRLYHMAEDNTWSGIREHGLLSTSALLDLFKVNGDDRRRLEESHRPECVPITNPDIGSAMLRDQKPMDDKGLSRALQGSGLYRRTGTKY